MSVRPAALALCALFPASAATRPLQPERDIASVSVLRRDEPLYTAPSTTAARRGTAALGARLPVFGAVRGDGCRGRFFCVGPLAWICEEGAEPSSAPAPAEQPRQRTADGMPYAYYFVGPDGSFGYSELELAEDGVPDAQLLPGFGVAIMREARKPGGELYGLTTGELWVPLRDLRPAAAPTFRGSGVGEALDVAWIARDEVRTRPRPLAPASGELLARLTAVRVLEEREHAGKSWLRVGDSAWLSSTDVKKPSKVLPPAGVKQGERWLDVDTQAQVLTAYAGGRPVFATLVSTGRGPESSELATPKGLHRIWVKLLVSDMDNLESLESRDVYAIQAVPWVMYFDRGYGLHGTFWHRSFGRVQSHGCVNLSPPDAEVLFDWVSPRLPQGWTAVLPTGYDAGTLVQVR